MKNLKVDKEKKYEKKNRFFSLLIVTIFIFLLIPIYIINFVTSILMVSWPLNKSSWIDISGNRVGLLKWNNGIFLTSASLFNVLVGEIDLVGNPLLRENISVPKVDNFRSPCTKPGLFDCLQLHALTGLKAEEPEVLLHTQAHQSMLADLAVITKILLCRTLFSGNPSRVGTYSVFGIQFRNCQMHEAVTWVLSDKDNNRCRSAYFLNANSINLAASNQTLLDTLKQSSCNFIDGSGMRIAVRKAGHSLADNCNGTDMLPLLCKSMEKSGQSLFLLGAQPGVAQQACKSLQQQYPKLKIVGSHHGYFNDDDAVVTKINNSRADILLVALGSPRQEIWIDKNKGRLSASCALAVGGLFDFFSGNIPRAPLWMRELGIEWVWRLIQEPKSKFKRYVIGNPMFLFRIYILNQAMRGL